jgi:hypothetical protein
VEAALRSTWLSNGTSRPAAWRWWWNSATRLTRGLDVIAEAAAADLAKARQLGYKSGGNSGDE